MHVSCFKDLGQIHLKLIGYYDSIALLCPIHFRKQYMYDWPYMDVFENGVLPMEMINNSDIH